MEHGAFFIDSAIQAIKDAHEALTKECNRGIWSTEYRKQIAELQFKLRCLELEIEGLAG